MNFVLPSCLFQIPWSLNFLPLVEHLKMINENPLSRWSLSVNSIPACSSITWVYFPGTVSFICFPNWHTAHLGISWEGIFAARLCSCCIACDAANAPVHSLNCTVRSSICPRKKCHQRSSLCSLDRLKFDACVAATCSCRGNAFWPKPKKRPKMVVFSWFRSLLPSQWSNFQNVGWTFKG